MYQWVSRESDPLDSPWLLIFYTIWTIKFDLFIEELWWLMRKHKRNTFKRKHFNYNVSKIWYGCAVCAFNGNWCTSEQTTCINVWSNFSRKKKTSTIFSKVNSLSSGLVMTEQRGGVVNTNLTIRFLQFFVRFLALTWYFCVQNDKSHISFTASTIINELQL